MKAAWTCRACCRVLQRSQKSRPGFQEFATPQLGLSRSFASEVSVASPAPADLDDQEPVPRAAATRRFSEAPRPSRSPRKPHESTIERPSYEVFEDAFKDRRGVELSGTKHGKRTRRPSKVQKETTTHPIVPDEFLQTPPITIPENYKWSKINLLQWRNAYSKIQAGAKIPPGGTPLWFSKDERWIAKLEWEEIRKLWTQSTMQQRCLLWEWLVLVTVVKYPQNTSMLLEMRLMEPTDPPRKQVANGVFQFITQYLQRGNANQSARRNVVERTHRLMLRFLRSGLPESRTAIWPATLGLFAQHMTRPQITELYHVLKDLRTPLTPNTELKFAYHLGGLRASDEDKRVAFELLQSYASRGENLTDPKVASVITSLLHQTFLGEASSFDVLQALQYFMERGYLPNAITVTAIVETLCERDDFPEAMHLIDLFKANGLSFDDKTYDTLLKGARHGGNETHLKQAFDFSKSSGAPEALLAKHALHALYLRCQRKGHSLGRFPESSYRHLGGEAQLPPSEIPHVAEQNQEGFTDMLRFYMERYELSSLQSLIPKPLPYFLWVDGDAKEAESSGQGESTLPTLLEKCVPVSKTMTLTPCSKTLALVLRAYVGSLWRPYDLMSTYSFFKQLLRDPKEASIGANSIVKEQGSFIHDSFILALMRSPALVRPALEVFADMLRDNHRDSRTGVHPPPSVYTFTIILEGLNRHKEYKLFDDFKHIMEENGVVPNLVTANTLVKGYASRQNMASTVAALQDVETLGYRPSQGTYHAFSKLKNQRRALDMMSEIIEKNKRRALGDSGE